MTENIQIVEIDKEIYKEAYLPRTHGIYPQRTNGPIESFFTKMG
jgi:hypothetical protein